MTKFLAIDYGLERTGLAVSDPDGKFAFPLATLSLKRFSRRSALLDAIAESAREQKVEAVVMGLPTRADGGETPMSVVARNALKRINRRLSLPAFFMPEYLSTQAAKSEFALINPQKKPPREKIDNRAACLILESFLAQAPEKRIRA